MADNNDLITLTADIVSSMVANNTVAATELPALIGSVHAALSQTANPVEPEAPKREPAVTIRSSVKHDYIVSLESGKKMKMLKRYLRTNYDMSPDEYRAKWGLPKDYPMVAPGYAAMRGELAKTFGLGRKKVGDGFEAVEEAVAKPVRVAGKKLGIVAAKAAAAAHLGGDAAPKKRGRPSKPKAE